MAGLRGNGPVTSLPPPRPRSPPEYPDLYGKRKELAKVQMLEREIGFLREELKSVEVLEPASVSCKEISEFVTANVDPFLPTTKATQRSCCFWKWMCRLPRLVISCVCCGGCSSHTEIQCCCKCDNMTCDPCCCKCDNMKCDSCCCFTTCFSCSLPRCHCFKNCRKSRCCKKPDCSQSCCRCSCSRCCSLPSCSCFKCCCWYPKCPKLKCSCNCFKNCCYSCCFC